MSEQTPTPVKDPPDSVTSRSGKRRSNNNRKSLSAVSTPLKSLLEQEKQLAEDKVKQFFSTQTITDRITGRASFKVKDSVKIEGITYLKGDVIPIETVQVWSLTDETGIPTTESDPGADLFKDSGDPDDETSNTYPSPLADNDPYWCWSVENVLLIAATVKPRFVVPTGDIFTPPVLSANSISYQAVKEKFGHTAANPFKFYKVSYQAVREIQDAVVTHTRKTTRADQEYSLYESFKLEFRQDLVARLRTHKENASMQANSHRRDGFYLETEMTEHFLSQLAPVFMLPLLLISTLPLIDTAGKASHESAMMAILRYESKRFMSLHSAYFADRISLFQNYTKVHEGVRVMTAEIIKFSRITEWWIGKWYPVKSYNTNITSWTELQHQAFDSTNTALTLHDLYSLWAVTDKKYRHFSHLLRDKLLVSSRMELDLQPASAHLMKLDGILDKRATKAYFQRGPASTSSSRSSNSGNTTVSSGSSTGSTSSNTSTLTTNNISQAVDTSLEAVNNMTTAYSAKPTTAHPTHRPTVSFQTPAEGRPTLVCFTQLVKGICNKPDCEKTFSHDEAVLSRTRKDLARQWSAGSTLGASRANLNLVQQLNINCEEDDDLKDVATYLANLELDVDLTEDPIDQEEDQE